MSRSYQSNTIVSLNYHGHDVDVYLAYQIDVDNNYGADADGNRGVRHVEVIFTDRYIERPKDVPFTQEDVDEILSTAEAKLCAQEGWGQ